MLNYDSSSLKTLKGLEAVKKRPGMYIGSTDEKGLHHLIWEIFDNAIDEVLAKKADTIEITIKNDNSVIIEDNGRGIPIDRHKETQKTGVELVFTELHSGGKFGDNDVYKVSSGLHGVGASVVNALSDKVEVFVYRNNLEYLTIFENGKITTFTKVLGKTSKNGTRIQFWPNFNIFKNTQFNFNKIKEKLKESSFLISRLNIKFNFEPNNKSLNFYSENGIKDFLIFMSEGKNTITEPIFFSGKLKDLEIDFGFQYNDNFNDMIISFANNIKTINGGTHEQGLRSAFTKTIIEYIKNQNLLKPKDPSLEWNDIIEGLVAIVSVKIPENILEFVGQTKESLRTSEAKQIVEDFVTKKLKVWLDENKIIAYKIANKIILASKARIMAKKAKNEARNIKKAFSKDKLILSNKLTPARSKKPIERELFLVEGNSAGGSAKGARDSYYQAVLPLRGKVINSEKAKLIDILKNEEIATIINTIGTGLTNDFNLKNLAYHKIIIMTDADTDGAHIQTLILTFFYRYMTPLIEKGYIYIALPPLYKLTNSKKQIFYAWTDEELKILTNKYKNSEIQRYKGLGEMNANQLWETTMNPKTRTLIKVTIKDIISIEKKVSTLMGEQVEPRKKWINENINFTLIDNFINFKDSHEK